MSVVWSFFYFAFGRMVELMMLRFRRRESTEARSWCCATSSRFSDVNIPGSPAVTGGDSVRYAQLNRALHAKIREIAQQATATRIIALLRNQFVQHQFRLSMIPGRPEVSVHEHDRIAKAIVAGDPVAAEEAMRAHLRSVKEMVMWSHELSQAQAG